jgi:DNA-binding transcriptional MerR regulator
MIKEHTIKRLYWNIGKVAEYYGCAASRIRFWCDELEIQTPRNRKNDRVFDVRAMQEIHLTWVIIQKLGYTLSGARTVLEIWRQENSRGSHLETLINQTYETIFEEPFPQGLHQQNVN